MDGLNVLADSNTTLPTNHHDFLKRKTEQSYRDEDSLVYTISACNVCLLR